MGGEKSGKRKMVGREGGGRQRGEGDGKCGGRIGM